MFLKNYLQKIYTNQIKFYLKPEVYLHKKYSKNPYYPFKQLDSYVFECNYRYIDRFCFYFGLTIFLAVVNIDYVFHSTFVSWYIVVLLSVLAILMLITSQYYFAKRTIRLDLLDFKYELYIGNRLLTTSHLHNLFIRLVEKHILKNHFAYKLIIDGKSLDQLTIVSFTSNLSVYRTFGRKLARNLCLNYFDIDSTSAYHELIHYCPFTDQHMDVWKFLIDKKKLIVKKKQLYWLRPNAIEQYFFIDTLTQHENSKRQSLISEYTMHSGLLNIASSLMDNSHRGSSMQNNYQSYCDENNDVEDANVQVVKKKLAKIASKITTIRSIATPKRGSY